MNKLIYGKNSLEKIVSIECSGDTATIFLEPSPGLIETVEVPFEHWVLFANNLSDKFKRLKGNLHYKYYIGYTDRRKYLDVCKSAREKRQDFYTSHRADEALMIKDGYTFFKSMEMQDVSVLSFDIETVGLEMNPSSKVLLISNTYRAGDKIEKKLFCYDDYDSTRAFLEDWCAWVREKDPSIICGHNIFSYDLPYIVYCASINNAKIKLGRDASEVSISNYTSKFRRDSSITYDYNNVSIYGRQVIDTMFMAIKFDIGRNYASYGLKPIISHEGLEKKDRQHYDASKIFKNYTNPTEWVKIKDYARDDADDALALFDLMGSAYFKYAQIVPMSFQQIINKATGKQVDNVMIRSYLQEGHSIAKPSEAEQYEGAISFGNPGVYRPTYKVDVASLYPSIIRQYKVYDRAKDPQGHFLKIVDQLTIDRLENKQLAKETKNRAFSDLEQAQKILINSAYGFLGATGVCFNSPKNAAFITRKGREILTKGIKWVEDKGYKIANVDTDSFMYTGPTLAYGKAKKGEVPQFLKDIEHLNSLFPELIRWENDGCYKAALIIKAKNYALDDGKKVKIKGSALKASMKEPALKQFLGEVINLLLNGQKDRVFHRYLDYVNEILTVKDMSRWAFRKTVTRAILTSDRSNEARVRDVIYGRGYSEGEKVHLYFKSADQYALLEDFNGEYDTSILLGKLRKTLGIFDTVLDVELFPDLTLKRNKDLVA